MSVLKISNVYKSFRQGFFGVRTPVLEGLDLSLEEGEVYGFLGHNGAGKTTTMKVVLDLVRPDSGEVTVFGSRGVTTADRARIGYLTEEIGVYPHLTAVEMLSLAGELFRIPRPALRRRIDELLEEVGLAHRRSVKIKHYSKGMRQRLGIAVALVNDPDLLLLDEPYSGLDPVGRKELRELLLQLKERGKTIMLSSHIVPDVEAVCDRVGILRGGKIARVLDLNEIYSDRNNDVEVVFAGVDHGKIDARDYSGELIHSDERVTIIRCNGDQKLRALVNHVYDAGGNIVGVRQVRLNLEDAFVEEVGRANDKRQKRRDGQLVHI